MPSDTPPRASTAAQALVAGFALVGVYLLWASLPWPLIHDAPILHYIARRIAAGAVPYRDVFDMNQPGVYLLHRAVVAVFGDTDFAWRLFDVGWLALTGALLWAFARPWGPVAAAGSAALFAVYHLAGGAWQAGQRDFVLCAFLLAGALGVAGWLDAASGARWRLAVAGLALGAGVTLKPHALLFALALGLLALAAGSRLARPLRDLVLYAAGLVAPPLVVLAWLAARGALGAWGAIVVDYLVPLYARLGRPDDWQFWRVEVWIALGAAVVLSVATAAWGRRLTWRHGIALLGVAYGLVHYVGQRKGWEYHLYPLAVFAAVLAFSEVDRLLAGRRFVPGGLVAAALVATVVLLGVRGVQTSEADWIWDKERTVRLLVDDLRSRMAPGDRVQVLDTAEGGIHALLRLGAAQATRFIYDFHFFHDVDHPTIQRLRSDFMRELTAQPPRFVVVFEHGWPSGRLDRVGRFPALSRFLEEGYGVVQRRPAYVILEKRQRP
ncbi:MAG: glycosyltransferase family 39 protein [Candidatus Rokubacteria bacterium]|nr:glycosyltransferase family 39 protein [Candidatus Rokubacteria bacterium]